MIRLRFVWDVLVTPENAKKFLRSDTDKPLAAASKFLLYTFFQLIGAEVSKVEFQGSHVHNAEEDSCQQDIDHATDGKS